MGRLPQQKYVEIILQQELGPKLVELQCLPIFGSGTRNG